MTIYTLILIALWPSGDIAAMTTSPLMFNDKEACEDAGEAWNAAGLRLEHLCLPATVELLP